MMLGLYLGLIAIWFLFCLVFSPKPGRTAIFLPIILPWALFVIGGKVFFQWVEDGTRQLVFELGQWLNSLGSTGVK